ncbi:class I SAM-dependent methyltransferase [Actinomadura darangshiensis]|uniref:Class I SAM-dependent methyltransferase n=1 Tax=Actinomadura darangshiensis TaxID=705336 RepID=A0A4R5BQI9_9ACTN|nr:class I SAM-dependent methyltransferase [Actinomadura darangshiensis]TDD86332.1 class I SAM-dependent methyltransferase [Actinomadura darangshiensis]
MTDLSHPIFARLYPRLDAGCAKAGGDAHRAELLAGVSGRVLEVGAGYGANFAHYPPGVTEVVAVEPEPRLRARAGHAAGRAPVPVTVRPGVAEDLDLDDASFDVAVVSLVLCSVRDPARALAELRRVLRPGGELRYYEHVRGSTPGKVRFQRAADVVWPFFAAGCHLTRRTDARIARSGFTVRDERHFEFPDSGKGNPASPHVLGIAIRD